MSRIGGLCAINTLIFFPLNSRGTYRCVCNLIFLIYISASGSSNNADRQTRLIVVVDDASIHPSGNSPEYLHEGILEPLRLSDATLNIHKSLSHACMHSCGSLCEPL